MSEFSIKLKKWATLQKLNTGKEFREIAAEIGTTPNHFSNMVTGKTQKPHPNTARKIVDITKGEITMKDMGYE